MANPVPKCCSLRTRNFASRNDKAPIPPCFTDQTFPTQFKQQGTSQWLLYLFLLCLLAAPLWLQMTRKAVQRETCDSFAQQLAEQVAVVKIGAFSSTASERMEDVLKLRLDSHLLPKVSAACFLWPRVEQLARRVWLTPALWESFHPC